jgi:hypothetical protein
MEKEKHFDQEEQGRDEGGLSAARNGAGESSPAALEREVPVAVASEVMPRTFNDCMDLEIRSMLPGVSSEERMLLEKRLRWAPMTPGETKKKDKLIEQWLFSNYGLSLRTAQKLEQFFKNKYGLGPTPGEKEEKATEPDEHLPAEPEATTEEAPKARENQLGLSQCLDFELQTLFLDASPEERKLLDRVQRGEKLSPEKESQRHAAISRLWEQKYGFPFNQKARRRELLTAKYNPEQYLRGEKKEGKAGERTDMAASQIANERVSSDGGTKGGEPVWIKHWEKRLLPELAILPDQIREIIIAHQKGGTLEPSQTASLLEYVKNRNEVVKSRDAKQREMQRLQHRLAEIEAGTDYSEEEKARRRPLRYDEAAGAFFAPESSTPLSYDDIAADAEWGIQYYPDAAMPTHERRMVRKVSDIAEARKSIDHISNEEMCRALKISGGSTMMPEGFLLDKKNIQGAVVGFVAERMMRTFLMRLQNASEDFRFKVEPANALEDQELKYDFKVFIPARTRGIAVEGDDMPREQYIEEKRKLGVQFTTMKTSGWGKKAKQVWGAKEKVHGPEAMSFIKRRVDDIVLLSLYLGAYRRCMVEWLDAGQPSGGPEQFLTRDEKIKILKAVSDNFLHISEEQIEAAVQ